VGSDEGLLATHGGVERHLADQRRLDILDPYT